MNQEFIDFTKKKFAENAPEINLIDIYEIDAPEKSGRFYQLKMNFGNGDKDLNLFVPYDCKLTSDVDINMYSQLFLIEAIRESNKK